MRNCDYENAILPLSVAGPKWYFIWLKRTPRSGTALAAVLQMLNTSLRAASAACRKQSMLLFLILLLMLPASLHAQAWSGIISPGRAIDWSRAGVTGGIPQRATNCSTNKA